jgi:hypothetical protein
MAVGDYGAEGLVDLVRDRSGEFSDRRYTRDVRQFRLCLAEFFFRQLVPGDLPLKCDHPTVVARVHVILYPLSQRSIIKLIGNHYAFRHNATERFLVRHLWKFIPQNLSDETLGVFTQELHLLGSMLVEISKSPGAIKTDV